MLDANDDDKDKNEITVDNDDVINNNGSDGWYISR